MRLYLPYQHRKPPLRKLLLERSVPPKHFFFFALLIDIKVASHEASRARTQLLVTYLVTLRHIFGFSMCHYLGNRGKNICRRDKGCVAVKEAVIVVQYFDVFKMD